MILVTGGLGFIGSHTARELLDAGEHVVVTRHRRTEVPTFLEPDLDGRLRVETLDVTDVEAVATVVKRYDVDGIVHLAGPPRQGLSPIEELQAATGGLLAICDAAGTAGVGRVSVASSVLVYGRPTVGPATEDQPLSLDADDPIQAAKLAEEALGAYVAHRTGADLTFLRIAVIYGPGYRTLLNAPARLCQLALGRADRVDHLPDPRRAHPDDLTDLCYVKDCARAIRTIQLAPGPVPLAINVGAGHPTRMADLVAAVNGAVPGADLALAPAAGDAAPAGPAMDTTRLAGCGFTPEWDLDRAVADYVGWLRDHEV